MAHAAHGPSHADVKAIQRNLHERSPRTRAARMDEAFTRLLRDLNALGGTPRNTPAYRRLRKIVMQRKREYLAARDQWVESLVDERNAYHRIDVSQPTDDDLRRCAQGATSR